MSDILFDAYHHVIKRVRSVLTRQTFALRRLCNESQCSIAPSICHERKARIHAHWTRRIPQHLSTRICSTNMVSNPTLNACHPANINSRCLDSMYGSPAHNTRGIATQSLQKTSIALSEVWYSIMQQRTDWFSSEGCGPISHVCYSRCPHCDPASWMYPTPSASFGWYSIPWAPMIRRAPSWEAHSDSYDV